MTDCEEFEMLMSAVSDGEASEEEKARLDAHLAVCESCRREFALLGGVSSLLSEPIEPPEGLHRRIMEGIEAPKRKTPPLKILPLVACLVLVIFTALRFGIPERPTADTANDAGVFMEAESAATDEAEDEVAACEPADDCDSVTFNSAAKMIEQSDSDLYARLRELLTPAKPSVKEDAANEAYSVRAAADYTVTFPDTGETVEIFIDGGTAYADLGEGRFPVTGTPEEFAELLG